MHDLISRQAAIDAIERSGLTDDPCDTAVRLIEALPSAQPERLTDDDFETIRIHLNAQKEKLCNQRRWKEAEEYQRIIDRFMAFASAQPEIIRCKDCKYFEYDHPYIIQGIPVLGHEVCNAWGDGCKTDENGYCFMAERREE